MPRSVVVCGISPGRYGRVASLYEAALGDAYAIAVVRSPPMVVNAPLMSVARPFMPTVAAKATKAINSAYSIRSWPCSSFNASFSKYIFTDILISRSFM
jgi:hypothetical protein